VRLESVETKLSEVQSTESKVIKNIESQLGGYHKEITSALASNSSPTINPDPSTPLQVSEDSVAQTANLLHLSNKLIYLWAKLILTLFKAMFNFKHSVRTS